MSILSWEQTARDAYAAGFRGMDLVRIVATAFAESTFRTTASNGTHIGILQFDQGTAAQAGFHNWSDMLDPMKAFRAAYNLVYGKNGAPRRGFEPWQGDGYQAYMGHAQQVVFSTFGTAGAYSGFSDAPGTAGGQGSAGGGISVPGVNISFPSIPTAGAIGGAIGNAFMDAGRSLLPYLVILGIIGTGLIFVLSGVSPANRLAKAA